MAKAVGRAAVGYTRTHAITDGVVKITVTSMDKGLFPFVLLVCLFAFMVWRMPPADVTKLVMRIVQLIADGALLGWVLWIATLGLSFVLIQSLRRLHGQEVGRIAAERDHFQQQALPGEVRSSNPRSGTPERGGTRT